MLVSIKLGSRIIPGISANSVAKNYAFLLSTIILSSQSIKLTRPQALKIPVYRIAPPSIFLNTFALAMSEALPAIIDPAGHPMPLLKHTLTMSKSLTISFIEIPRLTDAFHALAPSK